MFTDESMFRETSNGIDYVIRFPSEKYNEKFIHQCKQQGGEAVMVWGGVYGNQRTPLYLHPDRSSLNAQKYIDILKKLGIPDLVSQKHLTFQQDNAPIHNARLT